MILRPCGGSYKAIGSAYYHIYPELKKRFCFQRVRDWLITIGRISLINFPKDTGEKTQKDPTLTVDSLVAYEGSIRFFDLI